MKAYADESRGQQRYRYLLTSLDYSESSQETCGLYFSLYFYSKSSNCIYLVKDRDIANVEIAA